MTGDDLQTIAYAVVLVSLGSLLIYLIVAPLL